MSKIVSIKQKNIKVSVKDRRKMLFYTNVLKELRNDTSDKVPVKYQTICELEELLYIDDIPLNFFFHLMKLFHTIR